MAGKILLTNTMFLTLPTVEELTQSDLSELVEMLAKHSAEYTRLYKLEGRSHTTDAAKELIIRLQLAIEAKRSPQIDRAQK